MNFKDKRNVLLAKKAVYAEQLHYYSKLCEIYQALALEIIKNPDLPSDTDMESRYSEPLSKVAESTDLEKTMQELYDKYVLPLGDLSDGLQLGRKYTLEELKQFREYGRISNIFRTFQNASKKLNTIYSADKESQTGAISDFHSYMQSPNNPRVIRNFDDLLSVHSPRYLGGRFFLLANNAIERIQEIDETHIPLDSSIAINEHLTPENFGAIINGCKTISSKISQLEKNQGESFGFNIDNWDLSNNSPEKVDEAQEDFESTKHSITESAYVAGNSVKNTATRLYKAHKGTAKAALLTAAAIATIVTSAVAIRNTSISNSLDAFSSSEYNQTINNDTKQYIANIIEQLNLQSNSFDPQYQDVKDIENNIDLVLDYIVKDQVTTAFEQYHKGCTVTDVFSWFDKSYQSNSADGPQSYQFIDVSYTDENGQPKVETISDFRAQFCTENSLQEIFALEEKIDLDSPVWNAFNNNGTTNFLQRAENIDDVMKYLDDAVKVVRHSAAFGIEHGHTAIFGTPYLKSTLPEKSDDSDER